MLINLEKVLYTTIGNWYISLIDILHFKPFTRKDRHLHAIKIYIYAHIYVYVYICYVNEISFASPRHSCQIPSYKKTFKSSDFLKCLTLEYVIKKTTGESGSFNKMILLNRKLMIISTTLLSAYYYYIPRTAKI